MLTKYVVVQEMLVRIMKLLHRRPRFCTEENRTSWRILRFIQDRPLTLLRLCGYVLTAEDLRNMLREAQAQGDPYAIPRLPEPDSALIECVEQQL